MNVGQSTTQPQQNDVRQQRREVYVNNNNEPLIQGLQNEALTRERLKAFDKSSTFEEKDTASDRSVMIQSWIGAKRRNSSRSKSHDRIFEPASSHKPMQSATSSRSTPLNASFEDSVFYSQQYEEVLQTARGLCRDYICYRMKRSGFRGRVVITKHAPAKDQNLSFDVLKIGKTFEDLYPHLFRNLARQLGYVLRSDEELRVLFERLGAQIIGPDPAEYRWGRVLALLAVAGSLSVDCIGQGHIELIENVVAIFCDFIEVNLLNWIMDNGGWEGMASLFAEKEKKSQTTMDLLQRTFRVNLFHAACTGVVIAGIAMTYGALSRTF